MARTGQFLTVEADISRAQVALAGTSKSLLSISRQTMGIIGRGVANVTTQAVKSSVEKVTGEMWKAYRYKVKKDGSEVTVFPKALKGNKNIFPKAMALNYGTKDGRLKPRGFVQAGERYAESNAYEAEIDKMIQKELSKYWK